MSAPEQQQAGRDGRRRMPNMPTMTASIPGVKSDVTSSRVGILLKDVVRRSSTNRRSDLMALTEQYNLLRERLKVLVTALRAEHDALLKLSEARLGTAKAISSISSNSPIYDCSGKLPSPEAPMACSFASIHTNRCDQNKVFHDRYGQFIVNYTVEWEKTVNNRIIAGLKKNDTLRRELDHYERKVDSLRQSANTTMSRGKMVDAKVADKLTRNENKLLESRNEYEKFSRELCMLMEEMTARAWKDLHPLVLKMTQFDSTLSTEEAKSFSELNTVMGFLKDISNKHNLKPQTRLKELETMDAKLLYSSTPDSAGHIRSDSDLMGGGDGGLLTGTSEAPNVNFDSTPASRSSSVGNLNTTDTNLDFFSDFTPIGNTNQSTTQKLSFTDDFSSLSLRSSPPNSGYKALGSNPNLLAAAAAAAPPPTLDMLDFGDDTTSAPPAPAPVAPPPGPPPPPPSALISTNPNPNQWNTPPPQQPPPPNRGAMTSYQPRPHMQQNQPPPNQYHPPQFSGMQRHPQYQPPQRQQPGAMQPYNGPPPQQQPGAMQPFKPGPPPQQKPGAMQPYNGPPPQQQPGAMQPYNSGPPRPGYQRMNSNPFE